MILNGKNIDIDILEAETAEKYAEALNYVSNVSVDTSGSMSESIKRQCGIVYTFFDMVLGNGEAEKLFDGKYSLAVCIDVYEDFINQATAQCKKYTSKFGKAAKK